MFVKSWIHEEWGPKFIPFQTHVLIQKSAGWKTAMSKQWII
jgi:hypothetical protein